MAQNNQKSYTYTPSSNTSNTYNDTYSDTLSNYQIEELLEDYKEVDDIKKEKIGVHVRYYTIVEKDGVAKKAFRMGGYLISISDDKTFVTLTNNKKNRWFVNIDKSIFYRQITLNEMKNDYEDICDDYEDEIRELKMINKKLYKKLTGFDKTMRTNHGMLNKQHQKQYIDKEDVKMKPVSHNIIKPDSTNSIEIKYSSKKEKISSGLMTTKSKSSASDLKKNKTINKPKIILRPANDHDDDYTDYEYKEGNVNNMTDSYIAKKYVKL